MEWNGAGLEFRLDDAAELPCSVRSSTTSRRSPPRWVCWKTDIRATGLPVQQVSCGVPFVFVPLANRAAVDRAVPDARLHELRGVSLHDRSRGAADAATTYSRMFAPQLGIIEDPATGSASGPLGSYLVHHSVVAPGEARAMLNLQGVKLGRPSWIHISIEVRRRQHLTGARGRHVGVRGGRHDGSGGVARADRIRPASVQRRHAASRLRKARRAPAARSTAESGVHFAVWAPNAEQVSVIGDFNGWNARSHPMRNLGASGIWETFVPERRRRRALQVRDPIARRRRQAAEGRSVRLLLRVRRQRRGHRLGSRPPCVARPRVDGAARHNNRLARPADVDLRSASRLVEARAGARERASDIPRAGRSSSCRT